MAILKTLQLVQTKYCQELTSDLRLFPYGITICTQNEYQFLNME